MNYVIGIALALLLAWAIWHSLKRARRGGGCCGEHEPVPSKQRVRDRNRAHYPYETRLCIGGMSCEACARKVENALNSLDGVWAEVDISTHTALIRSKAVPDVMLLGEKVREAGYAVLP